MARLIDFVSTLALLAIVLLLPGVAPGSEAFLTVNALNGLLVIGLYLLALKAFLLVMWRWPLNEIFSGQTISNAGIVTASFLLAVGLCLFSAAY